MTKSIFISKYFIVTLLIFAFVLNWIWEVAQNSAYKTAEKSMFESLLFCTLASVIDALTILAIYGAAKYLFGRGSWKIYLTAALLGALCAVVFEKIAFAFGWWSYHPKMPTVPLLGTGLSPLLQLTLLSPLAIWLAVFRFKRKRRNNEKIRTVI